MDSPRGVWQWYRLRSVRMRQHLTSMVPLDGDALLVEKDLSLVSHTGPAMNAKSACFA